MTDQPSSQMKRNIWLRGIYMLLMSLIVHLIITVIFVVVVIQFIVTLLNNAPNERLFKFGHSLSVYLIQIIGFLTFAVEEIPFPFSDWPKE